MEIVRIPIDELTPDPHNAKEHPAFQIEQIKASIEQFGNADPIGVWGEKNLVVEGHGRLIALKELGYTEVECIRLDWLSEEERRAYALVHNQTTMTSGWLQEELENALKSIQEIDMTQFGFAIQDLEDDLEIIEDEIPEEPEPRTKTGDIWQLGEHRLICGDSTDEKIIEKLANGEKINLYVSDPPYNIAYETKAGKIANDNLDSAEFKNFLFKAFFAAFSLLEPGAAVYIWHSDKETSSFREAMEKNGVQVKQCLIWNKSQFTLGRQDYQWKHEPCLYGWKEGSHYFIDDRTQCTVIEDAGLDFRKMKKEEMRKLLEQIYESGIQTTVLNEQKPSKSDLHPTMKPVNLIARLIRNSSKPGWTVLDSFGGSGTTMIAAEQLGRKCLMCELDPHYCDVIIERWENFTGRKAELLNDEG